MVEVTVKLNKNSGPVEYRLVLPNKWNELTAAQLLYIAKYWQSWLDLSRLGESLKKAKALLLLELTGYGRVKKKALCLALSFIEPPLPVDGIEQVAVNILDCTNFVFEKLDLTKNIFPRIKVGLFTWYYGPGDMLKDISADEFSFAFGCYAQFNASGSTHTGALDALVAVLYRPRNKTKEFLRTGEVRKPFSNLLVGEYEKKVTRLNDEYKHAVYLFFRGCLESMAKRYPVVFRAGEKDQASGATFVDTIIRMSGGKFGPYGSTKQENIYVILKELEDMIKSTPAKPGTTPS